MSWRISAGLSLLAAVVFYASTAPRAADEPKPSPPGHLVALMDYDHAFQNSLRYKTELDQLKAGTAKVENELKAFHDSVHKLEEELKALQPGSPDFIKKQEAATLKQHELQARIKIERTKFEQQRVKLETALLKEIDQITKQVAVANNIALVLNQDTREQPLRDLEATQQHRQRRVVYHNAGLDITAIVLSKLNDSYNEKANALPLPAANAKLATPAKQ